MHRWFSASSVLTAVCLINFMTAYGSRLLPKKVLKITPIEYTHLVVTGTNSDWVVYLRPRPEPEQSIKRAQISGND